MDGNWSRRDASEEPDHGDGVDLVDFQRKFPRQSQLNDYNRGIVTQSERTRSILESTPWSPWSRSPSDQTLLRIELQSLRFALNRLSTAMEQNNYRPPKWDPSLSDLHKDVTTWTNKINSFIAISDNSQ